MWFHLYGMFIYSCGWCCAVILVLILYTLLCLTHSWGPFGLQLAGWLARQVPVVRACLSCCGSVVCLFTLEIIVDCKVFGIKDRLWSF
ncbi:hypothetical protein RHGRI_027748 [Rhododendron griersonianum]|uniref:Uncharacterized protein n=1 Tax=Rhododendron griersonianum TaxID=479676 RepID=A0AAV6J0B1_9ERIC|nr:hypothetical protein RHGRI_027748 [Rhododendron griersonianum]